MNRISKTIIAVLSSIGLTFGLFSAPAQAAEVFSGSMNIQRTYNSSDGSFQVFSGESASVYFSYEVDMTSVAPGTVITFASTGDIQNLESRWIAGNDPEGAPGVNTYTVPPTEPTSLELRVMGDKNAIADGSMIFLPLVTSNPAGVVDSDSFTIASVNAEISPSGYTAKAVDEALNYFSRVCVDLAQVEPSDELEVSASISPATISSPGSAMWSTDSGPLNAIGSQNQNERTVPDPEPTFIDAIVQRGYFGLTTGSTYVFSVDIKKKGTSTSVAIESCPTGGPGLYSLGGATVSGTFGAGSTLTATPNQWSRTDGGPAETVTNRYDWVVCNVPQATSTTSPEDVPCIATQDALQFVLADGNSIGSSERGQVALYDSSTLSLSQTLLDLLAGKYLMVVIGGQVENPSAASYLFMETCGPITVGLVCSVAFGTSKPTVDTPAANTPTVNTPAVVTPTVGSAAALAALPKSSTQPKLKFDSSSNGLSKSAKKSLKKVAKVAKTGYAVRVTGAAGMQPGVSKEVAKALAKKRAMEIRAYLIKQGVDKKNIIIKTKVYPIGKAAVTKVKVEVIK